MHTALKYVTGLGACAASAATLALAADAPAKPQAGQVHLAGAGRPRVLRVQGIRVVAARLGQPKRKATGRDPRQSRDDRGLRGRHTRNGKPFPDGARIAKIHYVPRRTSTFRCDRAGGSARRRLHGEGQQAIRGRGGWGYAVFSYDAATTRSRPARRRRPRGERRQVRRRCHTIAKSKDYVFTE